MQSAKLWTRLFHSLTPTLWQVAAHYGDMSDTTTTPVLAKLIIQKMSTTITDYFNSDRSAVRAQWIVNVITQTLPVAQKVRCGSIDVPCFFP